MYKYLIIGTACMFISAGAYYINQAGGGLMGNIITGKITSEANLTPLNPEDIPGIYVCKTASTCKNTYTLILKSDKTVELTQTLNTPSTANVSSSEIDSGDNTQELTSFTEKGTWDLGVQNMLVITILNRGETAYDVPQKIVIKNVRTTTLSKISYTRSNYKDMSNPIFIRQE